MHSFRPAVGCAAAIVAAVALAATPTSAQDAKAGQRKPPEELTLLAKDGMVLKATFYSGTKGKESVPVLIIPGLGGNRQEYQALASHLQAKVGCAVVAVDLRGQGDSTRFRGSDLQLDAKTMPAVQFGNIVRLDLESVRSELFTRHNLGELNLDKLCLVGADTGAILAAMWTQHDWSAPPLATGKQGQDVKGIVMLSPTFTFKALKMLDPLNSEAVRKRVSILIAVGKEDPKTFKDADRIYAQLERFHPKPVREEDETLFWNALDTKLQGANLVKSNDFKLHDAIAAFVEQRMVKQPYPWQPRKNPLE